jgi:hypothetical protein
MRVYVSATATVYLPTDKLQTTRRFWVLAVVVTTIAGFCSSTAAVALHYTKRDDSEFGCKLETLNMLGSFNTNAYCTREMAFCNFLPRYMSAGERDTAGLACNETITVKWIQIVLAVNSLVLLAMFSTQAHLRRRSRVINEKDDSLPQPR